jgi:hypothetical protein
MRKPVQSEITTTIEKSFRGVDVIPLDKTLRVTHGETSLDFDREKILKALAEGVYRKFWSKYSSFVRNEAEKNYQNLREKLREMGVDPDTIG